MTADGRDPSEPPAPQGPPIFVNPDDLTAQGYAPPTFVRHDGTPVQPAAPQGQPMAGAPTFVLPGAAPGPAAPPQIPGAPAEPGYTVAGGTPGGPVFVKKDLPDISLDEQRPWRWWVGPVAVAVAFMVVFVLGIAMAIVFTAGGSNVEDAFEDNTHWLGLAQDFLWVGVVLLVPFMAVRHLTPEHLGLRRQPFWRCVGVGALCMVAFYVIAGAYGAALGLDEDSNTLLQDTGFGDSVPRDVIFALLFTVAAPVAEELLFRGLLFRSLRDGFLAKFGKKGAVALGAIISGVIFGGIHVGGGQDSFLPVLMALGILLALAYQLSGTLYVPVTIHAINNAVATGFNSDPAADWIYGLIAAGPILSIACYWLLTRFIRGVFPQEAPEAPAPPTPPAVGPPMFGPSGPAANL